MHQDLYKKCLDASEFRTANEVMKSITKLQGLDINRIEAKVDATQSIDLTNINDETLSKIIDKLTSNDKDK